MDPSGVPQFVLSNGDKMPGIGLGTFGSDRYGPREIAGAVEDAVACGYRHIDCAAVYGNEREIGVALQNVLGDLAREELWVTSKLWNDKHSPGEVAPAFEKSLTDLRLDYLDCYLVHWPFPNYHAPKVDVSSRDPDAKPYIHEAFMATWRELEKLQARGLVRHIGTSNVTVSKLSRVLRDAEIRPSVNEMELHPHFQQPELFEFVKSNGIVPVAYSPLGSPSRPERDRTPDDSVDLEDPVIMAIAEKTGLSPASLCIKWAVQRGQIPIPFSVKREQYVASLEATTAPSLSDADMTAIASIDRNCRLIKGQVFMWPEAKSWHDLWDEPQGE
jgi:diketogulonate reductase-like aldo/keto reductase